MILTDESIVYQSHSKTEKKMSKLSHFQSTLLETQQRRDAKWPVQMRGSAAARARCRTEYTHDRTQCNGYPANRR